MSHEPVHVWTGQRVGGLFPNVAAALSHLRVITNDHRRNRDTLVMINGTVRYVGPRGKRHGTRVVAYIGTRDQLSMLGILVDELGRNLKGRR